MCDHGFGALPAASRLALPRWFDARMVVRILLVLASVVVGAKVFSSADSTTSVGSGSRTCPQVPASERRSRSRSRCVATAPTSLQ